MTGNENGAGLFTVTKLPVAAWSCHGTPRPLLRRQLLLSRPQPGGRATLFDQPGEFAAFEKIRARTGGGI